MRVFVSSTSEDLAAHRRAAADVIRDAQADPVLMEHFPADPRPIVDHCEAQMRDCDVVVLLQAHRYGWVPRPDQGGDGVASMTALEIGIADRLKIAVLAFLADDDWPGRLWDVDDMSRALTRRFRDGLNRTAKFFTWETDPQLPAFRALLRQELANHRQRIGVAPGASAPARLANAVLRQATPPPWPREPYPLLGPYEHPAVFGGRDADIARGVELVLQPPLVLCLHAASGTGKSSLLLAGLAPRLRAEGHAVSVERAPGDAGLTQRLLRDLFEEPAELSLDDSVASAATFFRWVVEAQARTGKVVVLVLDQIDDLLRNEASRAAALARLGPLLAATAQRLPGRQLFACKWVLCYRHEFHGIVRAWLEDVLVQARAANVTGLAALPHDLADAQRSHDWAVPQLGRLASGSDGVERAQQAFLDAILKPLRLRDQGRPRFRYSLSDPDAGRLAACFARARAAQPDAPLVPELQVVLNHLLQKAEAAATAADAQIVVTVPADKALDDEVRDALANHLDRVLNAIHPAGTDPAAAKLARARTLLALRQLADADGRRTEGLPQDELVRRLGAGGDKILAGLSAAASRLVVSAEGRCGLSHDRLAEVVAQRVSDEQSHGNLLLDQRLIDLQRVVAQKVGLYRADRKDESALSLRSAQVTLLTAQKDLLLFDEDHRSWWADSRALAKRRLKQRAVLVALGVASSAAVLVYSLPWRVDTITETLALEDSDWTVRGQVAVSASPAKGVARWTPGSPWPPDRYGAGRFTKVIVSPNGEYVAGVTADGALHVWPSADKTGAEGARILAMSSPVPVLTGGAWPSVLFSPDGSWLAAVSSDGGLHVWRADSPGEAIAVRRRALLITGDPKVAPHMSFSPKGGWLVVVENDGAVYLHRTDLAAPPALLGELPTGRTFGATFSFSDDDRWLAWERKSDDGGVLVVRDLAKAAEKKFPLPKLPTALGHQNNFHGWFSDDAQWFVGRRAFQPFVAWRQQDSVFAGGQIVAGATSSNRDFGVNPVRFDPANTWVVSVANDQRLHLWQTAKPPGLGDKPVFEEPYGSIAWSVAFHADRERIAAIAPDGVVYQWRLGTAPDVRSRLAQMTGGAIVRYDDAGRALWAMDYSHLAMGPAGEPMEDVITQVKGLQCITFDPDGAVLYAFGSSGVLVARREQLIWGLRLWSVSWPLLRTPMCLSDDH